MTWNLVTYLLYVVISIGLTVWVGRTLFRNGRVFLDDVFGGNAELAASVNHLLVVGFYLLNAGFVFFALKESGLITDATASMETLSVKVGRVLVVLGVIHVTNIYVLNKMRRRGAGVHATVPPIEPTAFLGAQ